MRCLCCGTDYHRGEFVCCRPIHGMKVSRWLEQHCASCRKCPKHCACKGYEPPLYEDLAELKAAIAAAVKRTAWDAGGGREA